jgi:uncharacterized protein (TIGR00369 family)
MNFEPSDPGFEQRVRNSFARQKANTLIGATLLKVAPGEVEVLMPYREHLTQQHGFLHGGIVTALLDLACGYAALTLMPKGAGVLAVEFKVNFLAPGEGESFVARGRGLKPRRSIAVSAGDFYCLRGGEEKLGATMLATMMVVKDRPGVVD